MQVPLDFQPRARRTDPSTSHEAARKVAGRVRENYQIISAYLASIDPRDDCYLGIEAKTGLDKHEIAKRLPEMVRLGLISITNRRVMPNGNRGTFYRIAGKPERRAA